MIEGVLDGSSKSFYGFAFQTVGLDATNKAVKNFVVKNASLPRYKKQHESLQTNRR